MTRSLFLPPPTEEKLRAFPRGPLKKIKPGVLFSLDTLRRAWLKVKATGGGAGVDGVTIERFERDLERNLKQLRADLLSQRYRPQPVKRLLVPKPGGDWRPLGLWALRDKLVQRVVYDCIEPYFEREFLECSFGYRPDRGVRKAVQAIIAQRQANRRWVADIDIQKCFDSLDPALVQRFVRWQVHDPFILHLIKAWLNANVFNDLSAWGTLAGASQGAVISPLLANIYLHEVDRQLTRQKFHLIRFADDMLICCRRKQEAERALQATGAALQQVRLELNPHKSGVVHFDQGFQFLGVFFLRNEFFYLEQGKKGSKK
jgi:group II intron reverse transcriptase/maturase